MLVPILLSAAMIAMPQGRGHDKHGKGGPPGQARGGDGVPPGLAKKGGMPPGLAKKFGPRIPEHPYIAVDPRHTDRAYFLIDGRWELRQGFNVGLQAEVRDTLRLAPVPPPVPLPRIGVDLHVVLFN
ncbi:hypothetical protein [Geothrix edaphica]|uniref:Uncharacterized protein n=1 Tax=Geothrix edaphica TaxID=2927976 RepID=A0ABQ5PT19_9BACT|nr:hypothetical protein [Geothrix edaphica]GLH65695.1 hypothetical protein GETHED_00590 [Geothrix edaphica]